MDETAVEKSGGRPLKPQLDRIFRMKSKRDLPAVLAALHLETGAGGLFFRFASNQDLADSTSVIAFAESGGLGLPDRDFYTKDDDKSRSSAPATRPTSRACSNSWAIRPARQGARPPGHGDRNSACRASLTRTERRDPTGSSTRWTQRA